MSFEKNLISLGDGCPTLIPEKWGCFKPLRSHYWLSPIIGGMSDNQGFKLNLANFNFWMKFSQWQKNSWAYCISAFTYILKNKWRWFQLTIIQNIPGYNCKRRPQA